MIRFFGRHRVRGTFYHIVSIIFLITTIMWYFEWISDGASYAITAILFITDYIAEMYDPHPDNPGPWFERHFHRFFDNGDEEEKKEIEWERAYQKMYNNEFDHLIDND